MEISDRADLFLSSEADGHQDCRKQKQHHCRYGGADGIDAFERRVVQITQLKRRKLALHLWRGTLASESFDEFTVSSLDIPFNRRRSGRFCSVNPHRDFRIVATLQVASEHRRNLDCLRNLASCKLGFKIVFVEQFRFLGEVSRGRETGTLDVLENGV